MLNLSIAFQVTVTRPAVVFYGSIAAIAILGSTKRPRVIDLLWRSQVHRRAVAANNPIVWRRYFVVLIFEITEKSSPHLADDHATRPGNANPRQSLDFIKDQIQPF